MEQRGEDEPGTYRKRIRNVPGTYQNCIMLPRWPILRVFLGPEWGIIISVSTHCGGATLWRSSVEEQCGVTLIWACVKTYPHDLCIKQPSTPNFDVLSP